MLKRVASLDITTESDGRATVPVGLNGQIVHLIVDTGSPDSVVANTVTDQLQLARHALPDGIYFQSYGGFVLTQFVSVDKLTLNGRALPPWRFVAAPDAMFPHDAKGLIGGDFLSAVDVDLDFGHGKVGFISPDHCPGKVIYWTRGDYAEVPMWQDDDRHIYVDVTLDGHEVEATIDTGSARSATTMRTARQHFDISEDDPALKPADRAESKDGDKPRALTYPFSSLTFGGVTVENPQIEILPTRNVAPWAPKLLIGMNVLRQLHVYIAYREKKLYLTLADAPDAGN